MSINKRENKECSGKQTKPGPKKGSGEKTQINVSVHKLNWNNAVKHWQRYRRQRKPSWLVDGLVRAYVETGGRILKAEAA